MKTFSALGKTPNTKSQNPNKSQIPKLKQIRTLRRDSFWDSLFVWVLEVVWNLLIVIWNFGQSPLSTDKNGAEFHVATFSPLPWFIALFHADSIKPTISNVS